MTISGSIYVAAYGIISLFVIDYMYHIFFIHSSVSGHLCCFYVLTIVNSAAMNTGVRISFQIRVFSGYTPGVGLLDSMATLFLVF